MAEKVERAVCAHSHPTLCDPMNYRPAGSPSPWDFPGKNTGVGCHFLLQGIFPTQGSILCLWGFLKWQVDSVTTEAPGSLRGQQCCIIVPDGKGDVVYTLPA